MLVANACQDDSRGCALANAADEITELDHPHAHYRAVPHPLLHSSEPRCVGAFAARAREGAHQSESLGDALMLLWVVS